MKAKHASLFLSTCLGLFVASAARAAEAHSLVNAPFNSDARVASYPPDAGTRFVEMAPGFSGWASGGQIRMTQDMGYGMDGSGGIFAEIVKDAKFYQISFQKLKLPMLRPGLVIRDPVRAVRFSFDAKIPAGKDFVVYMQVEPPKDVMPATPWSTRLVLGTVKGDDTYKTYTFNGTDIPEDTVNVFINYIRDLQLNGMTETVGSLVFHLNPTVWIAGDGFLFDNVKLEIAAY